MSFMHKLCCIYHSANIMDIGSTYVFVFIIYIDNIYVVVIDLYDGSSTSQLNVNKR